MKFISIRELRSSTAKLRKTLKEGREFILAANGKPFAVLAPLNPEYFEDELLAWKQARARMALNRLRAVAKARGLDKLTMTQINQIVAEVRKERLVKEKKMR
jgi:antitoxin (DNA-binding transcriptional repressor) of toxin-antitoxin stability system